MNDEWDNRQQLFLNFVREIIISWLLFIGLYILSYAIIAKFKKRPEREDYISSDEDAMVYRISLWICTLTLTISTGTVLLLPISIISNEILLTFEHSYYLKWLNESLIFGLWNIISLASNLALFILMPFAYFLTESEGFTGSKKGIMARVQETFVMLLLLAILVFGLFWVLSALLDETNSSHESLSIVWNYYIPFMYSCISLLGVLMLLISSPVGFACLFTVIGQLVVKPQFMADIEDQLHSIRLEEEHLNRQLLISKDKSSQHSNGNGQNSQSQGDDGIRTLQEQMVEVQLERTRLERRQRSSAWQRNFGYPVLWVALFALTIIFLFMVGWNIFQLLFGFESLPSKAQLHGLGKQSLSWLGALGASLEIILILYVMVASIVGFYSVPLFRKLLPKVKDTSMTKINANCAVLLILSSALPVLSRILGITGLDLMGAYGEIDWLGNFYIVFSYNCAFSVATALCLVNKVTLTVRDYLFIKLVNWYNKKKDGSNRATNSQLIANGGTSPGCGNSGSFDKAK